VQYGEVNGIECRSLTQLREKLIPSLGEDQS
jgi:hypothetical protein